MKSVGNTSNQSDQGAVKRWLSAANSAVNNGTSPAEAHNQLERELRKFHLGLESGTDLGVSSPRPAELTQLPSANECQDTAIIFQDKAKQALRDAARITDEAGAEAARESLLLRVLSCTVEANAWNCLASEQGNHSSNEITDGASLLWRWLATPEGTPGRLVALARLSEDANSHPPTNAGVNTNTVWTPSEDESLNDVLSTHEDEHGASIREHIKNGATPNGIRDLLAPRKAGINLDEQVSSLAGGGEEKVKGLRFDLAQNRWVQKDRSWSYSIPVEQLLEYQVRGKFNGLASFAERLQLSMTDPVTGQSRHQIEDIRNFVQDMFDSASRDEERVRELLALPIDMTFETTDGGDTPVNAIWDLSLRDEAQWISAFTDEAFRLRIGKEAEKFRKATRELTDANLAPLADLLQKYNGVPVRHKRAHGALINMGLAKQTVRMLGAETGALPRSRTHLTPERVRSEFADTEHVKMRFLFTDRFELMAIDDKIFNEVVEKYHFPPNHELLSYNRPLAGSGYLTISKGKIVALEDDTVMLPGKMPENLPPAMEVLTRLGYPLDAEKVLASFRVVNWAGFCSSVGDANLPKVDVLEPKTLRKRLLDSSHVERPGLIASIVRAFIESAPDKSPEAARLHATKMLVETLDGFQLINVSTRDFRSGALPSHLSEFQDLNIDESLAGAMVRKVMP